MKCITYLNLVESPLIKDTVIYLKKKNVFTHISQRTGIYMFLKLHMKIPTPHSDNAPHKFK